MVDEIYEIEVFKGKPNLETVEQYLAASNYYWTASIFVWVRSVWECLGKFFTKIFNGCKDFISLRPDKIGLAICQ